MMKKDIKIKKTIPISKIEKIKYSGFVYALKIRNDPSYCLSDGVLSSNCDLPDIDIDFEDRKRDQVRKYLEERYGFDNISGISTFLQMKGKATVRDICRVFDIPIKEADEFAKSIEYDGGESSILSAIENTLEGKVFKKRHPKETMLSARLEGTIKASGQHAAAVVVSSENLKGGTRGNLCRRGKDIIVSNWDMEDSEYVGLMKLDILGLSTLSILSEAKALIKENHGKDIHFNDFIIRENCTPVGDKNILKMLSRGNTVGIFQLSTPLSTDICKRLHIDNFEDISSVLAIARPGALHSGMTDEFIERKHKGKWKRKHKIYEGITKNTYGVLIYQEQVMEVFHKIAGLPYSVADNIRKIIGKKRDVKEFAPYKDQFSKGCLKMKTFNKSEVEWFWSMLLECANYLFNRSHSIEYAMLAYWTGFCVDGTTRLYDWEKKKYISISKAFKQKIKIIACYDEKTGKTIPGKVKKIIRTTGAKHKDLKMAYIMTTKSFKNLKCSLDHRILTPSGYKTLGQLKVGDLVAVERRITSSENPDVAKKISKAWKKKWKIMSKEERKRRSKISSLGGKACHESGAWKRYWNNLSRKKKEKRIAQFVSIQRDKGWHKRFVGYAKDGHKVYSSGELFLDNWLFENKIQHKTQIYIKQTKFRSDFYCKGVYIEFDGLKRKDSYFEKKFKDRAFVVIRSIDEIEDKLHFLLEEENMRNGNEVIFEPIKKIKKWKPRVMYDISMEEEPFNFLANGVVVHNCKYYYPTEFICASLTHGGDQKKEELIEEATRLKLKIVPPKIGLSDALKWTARNNNLYVPFVEVKGFGEATALKCAERGEIKRRGFFDLTFEGELNKRTNSAMRILGSVNKIPKIDRILQEIGAFNKEKIPSGIDRYFSFRISSADTHIMEIRERRWQGYGEGINLQSCTKCDLSEECTRPVHPSPGKYNVMIVGEAPGYEEDRQGKGFIGRAGRLIWEELSRHGLKREMFHVTNVNKCFPSQLKTPNEKQIKACFDAWLKKEVEKLKPCLILSFGNTGLKAFSDMESGITKMNGKTIWSNKVGTWTCFVIHPASVLRGGTDKKIFRKGIDEFGNRVKKLLKKRE